MIENFGELEKNYHQIYRDERYLELDLRTVEIEKKLDYLVGKIDYLVMHANHLAEDSLILRKQVAGLVNPVGISGPNDYNKKHYENGICICF